MRQRWRKRYNWLMKRGAKFKHKKIPRGPPSPPPPIMRSPPRKLTAEDQEMWKIPPPVSNWKVSATQDTIILVFNLCMSNLYLFHIEPQRFHGSSRQAVGGRRKRSTGCQHQRQIRPVL